MKRTSRSSTHSQFHKNRSRRIVLWLSILLVLILLSSCGLMYHLGKRAKDQAEPNKQTIRVQPEDEAQTVLSIYGVVRYADGTPCSNHTLELHSSPKTAQTGEDGSFFFYEVEQGDHRLTVLDADGNEKASMNFRISEHADKTLQYVKVTDRGQQFHFEIPVNTMLLDVNLDLDEQGQTLSLNTERVTAALTEGRVLTSQASVQVRDGEAAVFASGHYMLQDGTIYLANGGILFQDQGYLPPDAEPGELPDGVTVDSDGILHLEDQTRIDRSTGQITLPNGIVLHPDQTVRMPDDSILEIPEYGDNAYLIRENGSDLIGNGSAGSRNVGIVSGDAESGNAQNRESGIEQEHFENQMETGTEARNTGNGNKAGNTNGMGDPNRTENTGSSESTSETENANNAGGTGAPENPNGTGSTGGSGTSGGSSGSGSSGGSSGNGNSGDSDNSGNSETTAPAEEPGSVEIGDRKTGKLWKQMAIIDLFTDLSGKQTYEILYPGIEGQYDFYIRNTMKTVTYMTVMVEEEANSSNGGALPLEYKILNEKGDVISGDWKNAAQLKEFSVTLKPEENVNYSIRWRWPYEKADSTGSVQASDDYDTKLGTSADLSHKLKLVIHVEQ